MAPNGVSSNCDASAGECHGSSPNGAAGSLGADGATLIALSVACGVLFVLFGVFAIAMCHWRMKYIKLQRELDGAADGIIDLEPCQEGNAATKPDGEREEPMASGAL